MTLEWLPMSLVLKVPILCSFSEPIIIIIVIISEAIMNAYE